MLVDEPRKSRGSRRPAVMNGAMWALEPRMMFDAAAAATVAADAAADKNAALPEPKAPHADNLHAPPTASPTGEQGTGTAMAATDTSATGDALTRLTTASVGDATTGRVELVFVSGDLSNLSTLIAGIDPGARLVVLDPTRDGVQQIAAVVAQYQGVDAIHIIADGTQASLRLGTATLTQASMQGQYATLLEGIGAHLGADADILIYGCYFGMGASGESAVSTLAGLTGADVAASIDATGHADLGGNWTLERTFGAIETKTLVSEWSQQNWRSLLGIFVDWTPFNGDADDLPNYPVTATDGVTTVTGVINDPSGITSGAAGTISGGTGVGDNPGGLGATIVLEQDATTNAQTSTYTFTFSAGVAGLSFSIADIDTVAGDYVDRVVITGSLGGAPVAPTLTASGAAVNIAGNTATGIGNVPGRGTTPDGNIVVNFAGNVDTVVITYGNDASAPADPSNQFIFISSLFVPPVSSPVNTVPGAQTTPEDTPLVFTGGNAVQVTDADSGTLTVVLSVDNGTLSLSGTTNLIFDVGDGTADTTMTFRGSIADINNALNNLTFTPTADFNGGATLSISTTDGLTTDTDTVPITITPVVDIANDTATTPQDTPVPISVLANDSFENTPAITAVDGNPITAGGAAVAVANGTVTLDAGGTILTFTPTAGFTGAAAFSYTATSGGVTETANVNVTVTAAAPGGGGSGGSGGPGGTPSGAPAVVPDNLWNADRPVLIGPGPIGVPRPLQPVSTPDPLAVVTLPVSEAVNGFGSLGAVVSVGVGADHPIGREVARIDGLQPFAQQIGRTPDLAIPIDARAELPITREVERIRHLSEFSDRFRDGSGDGRSVWDVAGLHHSVTLAPREATGRRALALGDHYLTVHTARYGEVLYVQIEHTRRARELYDVASFAATMADGRPLPAWMRLDPRNGVLSGVPPVDQGPLQIRVRATLDSGAVISGQVEIEPHSGNVTEVSTRESVKNADAGRPFSEQVAVEVERFDRELHALRLALGQ